MKVSEVKSCSGLYRDITSTKFLMVTFALAWMIPDVASKTVAFSMAKLKEPTIDYGFRQILSSATMDI